MSRLMILAGGTGGHVIPALAVAKELIELGVEVCWIGTRQGLESRLVPQAGIPFDPIDIKGLRNSGLSRKIQMPFMLLKSLFQTARLMFKRNPDAVLGMGGFVSGPGGLIAAVLKKPVILHEQNAIAGLTNRWLARISHNILSGFPAAKGIENARWVGNPVRSDIINITDPKARLENRSGPLRILVVGGSQGASVFNDYLPQLCKLDSLPELDIWHQSGSGRRNEIEEAYRRANIENRVAEFIEDMASAYEWCDIVICRSGAMTVSEICCAGAVAIFVPYPHAVNDHQAINADYLVKQDAAFLVRQEAFISGGWLPILIDLQGDRSKLAAMGSAARELAKPFATKEVAMNCMGAMGMEVTDA